jgi:3-deoxy-manno-octulosonate cytidylyltransferase (CMP-KDO synthetase)
MEPHGNNPDNLAIAIIPARFASTRLPGKMLLDLGGKPLVVRTAERARAAKTVGRVIVAADDERIFDAVTAAGFEAVMTRADHNSGSDRIAEAAEGLPAGSIIVNVQGDEPLIDPETIDRAVKAIAERGMRNAGFDEPDIVTVYEELRTSEELFDPNIVKVVTNEDGRALYFSRSPVPFPRDASNKYGGLREALAAEPELYSIFKKHVGLYVYRREYLLEFTKMTPTPLEQTEMLEQLRALENGAYIKVVEAAASSIGVDTEEDLAKVREFVQNAKVISN